MTLAQGFISAAIIALVIVSFLHSYFGEKLLIAPMFKRRGNAVLENDLARKVMRFAWHATSVMWVMMAVVLYPVGFEPADLSTTILLTFGIGFLLIGLFDLIASRGRHIGWPVLTAIGAFLLAANVVGGTTA